MNMKTDNAKIRELERIRKANGGILRPVDVVAAARSKSSPLHDSFEWDDSKAAQAHRLEQARYLIRFTIEKVGPEEKNIRAYVSLRSDREDGDSYRSLREVVSAKPLRDELLRQALSEADAWRKRYESFKELQEIFAAIKRAVAATTVLKSRTRGKTLRKSA